MHSIKTSAKLLLLLGLAAGVAACAGTPKAVSAGTDTTWHGNLMEGAKFGVATGQTAHDAQQEMLAAGYGFEGEFACSSGTHISPDLPAQAQCMKFQPVQPGERGHIYLRIEHGTVSQIVWDLTPVAYLDS